MNPLSGPRHEKSKPVFIIRYPVMSADVTRAVREATTLPMIVKLSPGAVDLIEIAQAVEEAGADAVSLINTLVGMTIDTRTRRPVLANNTGGLSGPAVRPVAVRMVYQVAQGREVAPDGFDIVGRRQRSRPPRQ